MTVAEIKEYIDDTLNKQEKMFVLNDEIPSVMYLRNTMRMVQTMLGELEPEEADALLKESKENE